MARSISARPLLLDVPLGILVGALSIAAARFSAVAAANGAPMADGRGDGFGRFHEHALWPGPAGVGTTSSPTWLLIVLALALTLGVAGRRLWPQTAYLLTITAGIAYLATGHPFGPVVAAPALALLAMARAMPLRRWLPWTVLLVPFVWSGFVSQPLFGLTDPDLYQALVFGLGLMVIPALLGLIRRNREDALRRTRELERRRSAFEERLRIARDVHDVLGHSLSVINMQAGVALHLLDRRPEQAETSLLAIKTTSKNALDELRATLAVFREEDYDGRRAPVAGLDRLGELIDGFRAGGRPVEVIGDGALGPLPAAVDLAGYRIIQEALTNVARHTRDASSRVELAVDHGRLRIMISNDGPLSTVPGRHDGTGIAGMTERARAVGGTLSAGPRPGGGFLVEAVLPTATPTGTGTGTGTGDHGPFGVRVREGETVESDPLPASR